MNGSAIHGKEKECAYIQSFHRRIHERRKCDCYSTVKPVGCPKMFQTMKITLKFVLIDILIWLKNIAWMTMSQKILFRSGRAEYQQIKDATTACLHVFLGSVTFLMYHRSVGVSKKGICCQRIVKWYQKIFNEVILLIQERYKETKIFKRTRRRTWQPCALNL